MKFSILLFSLTSLSACLALSLSHAGEDSVCLTNDSVLETYPTKLQEWMDAKFGLFIHWGPSSVAGVEIGWARASHPFDHPGKLELIPDAEYDALYKQFNPVDFDADALVRTAKAAGMKYLVFTAKHHDGFSNWATELSDYNIMNTPYGRDICRELADAVHKHGLKLGWYYSTRDWSHPDYLVGDNSAYNDYYHGQIRELLTNYGPVDVLWFDHVAGKWSDYRFEELFEMIYDLQPEILVNNRAAKFVMRHQAGTPPPELLELTKGDFETPEGKIGKFQVDYPWETCMPMSKGPDGHGGWSYRPEAITASFEECVKMLAACVTGGGNMLLNIGPMPSGNVRPEELENLKSLEAWMETYGESIHGTRAGPYISGQWGGACHKGDVVYLHVFEWVDGQLSLPALQRKVLGCEALGGESVSFTQTADTLTLRLRESKIRSLRSTVKQAERSLHRVIKLTLEPGEPMALIPVEGHVAKKQHDSLVNPMGE